MIQKKSSKFAFALKAQAPPTRPTLDNTRRPLNVSELAELSAINESAALKADSDDVANQLRNLFNVQM